MLYDNQEHKIRDREIRECLERKNLERKNNGKGWGIQEAREVFIGQDPNLEKIYRGQRVNARAVRQGSVLIFPKCWVLDFVNTYPC